MIRLALLLPVAALLLAGCGDLASNNNNAGSFEAQGDDWFDPAESDAYINQELAGTDWKEARAFVRGGGVWWTEGSVTGEDVVQMIDQLYAAGSPRVVAIGVEDNLCAWVAAELPEDADTRAAILAITNPMNDRNGYGTYPDKGQRWADVGFD